jgi:tetratricopeptide (TPR) repeat protein
MPREPWSSPASVQRSPLIAFGPFVLDVDAGRLLRDGREVKLRRQAVQVLSVLASHTGQRVTQEQLVAEAWPGVHISRHTVNVTVSEVRKALGDCGKWITRRTGEYRLLVPQSDALIALGRHVSAHDTSDGIRYGLDRFKDAAAQAPFDHRAFVGQCGCHLSLVSLGLVDGVRTWQAFSKAHARAAALVGPETLCADHGGALLLCQREVDAAEVELLRALTDAPAQPVACVWLMAVAVARGDLDAALVWATRARVAGPLLAVTSAAEVAAHVWRREFAVAVALGAEAVRIHPHFFLARLFHGMALQCSGREREALDQYRTGSVLSPDVPWARVLEAHCLIRLGQRREADAILDQLLDRRRKEYVDSLALAHLRMARGEMTRAIAELEQAMEEMNGRWYSLACDPLLEDLRAHRGFRPIWDQRFNRRPKRKRA